MPLTREERKLLHQKSKQPTFGSNKPDDKEGYEGDVSYRKVEGSGTVQYLKVNGTWSAISSSGSMPAVRMGGGGGSPVTISTSGGVTSHSALDNLDLDDHTQYLLIDGSRAMTGDLSLGGGDGALIFTVAGENSIKIPDNQASALIIEEANTAYLTFTTTNSGEKIQFHKALDIDAVSDFGSNAMTNVNIDSGAIDGTTIGASSSTTGAFTTITASTSIDITGSTGLILENDETITNSTNGTVLINGIVSAGTGSAAGVFQSNGDYDVTLQTGNSTTGVITITDGSNGNIDITPNGTGSAVIPKVDIGGGEIDGTAIGANSASTGAFTTVTASTSVDITGSAGLILQNDETITNAVNGTILLTAATTSLSGDLTVTGNNINFGNSSGIDNTTSGRVSVTDVGLGLHINTPVAFTSAGGMAHGTESATFDSFALRWKSHTSGSYKGQHIAGGESDYKNNYCMVGHSSETSKYASHEVDDAGVHFELQS